MARVDLSAELIYETALRIVDGEGLDALTMRHLAEEIGVATMSLYSHVSTKEDLLLGVVNQVTAEIGLPDAGTPPWEALKGVTREFRRVALRHPNLVPLIMRQPPTGYEGLRTLESALDALRRAGIEPPLAAQAYRLSASFAIGFVSLECGGFFRPVDVEAGAQVAPIELSALPRVAEMLPHLAKWDADAEFERGMDAVISVVSAWAGLGGAEMVQGHGGGGRHVQGVDAGPHGDPD
ncbi:MAG TPA: TetR/AcrR family transcriptional regulator, partial [Acidimicrobiales bacterium]|nr:TetR/AcrR family transcriptional regulator [Acidimicrobiales bacterium]